MTKEEAVEMLERAAAGKAEREERLRAEGYPAYTTQAGNFNRNRLTGLPDQSKLFCSGRVAGILRRQGQVPGRPVPRRGIHRLQDEGRQGPRGRQEEAQGMGLTLPK